MRLRRERGRVEDERERVEEIVKGERGVKESGGTGEEENKGRVGEEEI